VKWEGSDPKWAPLEKQSMTVIATYPFAGERGEAHGCVFQRRKMHGVATNVYLWKMSEKPKETGHEEINGYYKSNDRWKFILFFD